MGRNNAKRARNNSGEKNARTVFARAVEPAYCPGAAVPLDRSACLAAAFTFLAALVVYLLTVGTTVTGEDGGELVTAAYTLGIAHPPGYPLWCMLGKLFTLLVPFGSVAWRVNMMSGFWGSGAALVVCLIVIKQTRNRVAGVAAGLVLAFSSELWGQCTIAEVYSLNAFLIVSCLLILLTWQETGKNRLLYAFAFVYGLGLCNHHTMHFLGPVFALFILSVHRTPWPHWRAYLLMLGIAFVVWLAIHLYLPIRSLANPPMDWGNPETWQNFWNLVLRRQYGNFGLKVNGHGIGRLFEQIYVFLTMYGSQFTPWLAAIPLLGLYPLWKHDRRRFGLMVGIFLYITAGFIFILNYNIDKLSIWVNGVFFIPAHMMAAILIGVGIDWTGRSRIKNYTLRPVALALCIAMPVVPLAAHYHDSDRSDYYFAYDCAMNIFKTLDENALYFPTGDHRVFPLIYLQVVDGVRPDVVIADKYGYAEEYLYKDMPPAYRARFSNPPGEFDAPRIEDWIIAHNDRPAFLSKKRTIRTISGGESVNAGIAYKVAKTKEEKSEILSRDYWTEYAWHTLDEADTRGEFTAEIVLSDYHYFRSQDYFEKGESEKALEEMAQAAKLAGRSKENLGNFGIVCVEYKQYEIAKDYYQKSLEVDPNFLGSLRNLARLSTILDDAKTAIECLDRAYKSALAKYGPNNGLVAACANELATMIGAVGDNETALKYYKLALKSAEGAYGPDSPDITMYVNNAGVMESMMGNHRSALEHFQRALQIDQTAFGPEHPDVGRDLSNLSVVLSALGDSASAGKYRREAVKILTKSLGEDHASTCLAKQGSLIASIGT